jgi:hypothetical protein
MAAVQLSPLHNFWSDVFDFTPAEGAAAGAAGVQDSKHWQLLPAGTSLQQHMGLLPEQVQLLLGQTQQQEQLQHQPEVQQEVQQAPEQQAAVLQLLSEQDRQAVVCTAGALCSLQDIPEGCFAFLLFPQGHQEAALQWLVTQFPCPASNSSASLAAMCGSKRESSSSSDADSATAADDITVEEYSATEQSSRTAAVAGGDTASLVSAEVQQQQQVQQQQMQQPMLLRTNEAAVPAEVLQQIAAAANWSQAQVKQLSTSHTAAKGQKQDKQRTCYTGVEVSCSSTEQQAAVCSSAVPLGALACSSLQAAKLFRHLGTDG